jgi:hypothetical protein
MIDDPERLREDVRATAPEPRPEFTAQLERRVEAGFAAPKRPRRRRQPGLLRPAMALAASLLLVAVAGGVALNGAGTDEGAGGGGLFDASRQAPGDEGAASGGSGPAPPAGEAAAPSVERLDQAAPTTRSNESRPGDRRLVEQRTALELEAGRDEFGEVTAGVLRIADQTAAIVQRSNVSEQGGRGLATYDLRVPASRLDDALAQLSRLGTVTSRTASAQDITRPYVSARARLDDARAERQALLKALQRADTAAEADALRRRIRLARGRIAVAERDVRALQRRADRARVDVTVRGTGRLSEEGATWTPGDALDDAARILEIALGVVLVVLAAALPFLLIAVLWVAAARLARRRRREAALDPV